jgi:hypothetical protein
VQVLEVDDGLQFAADAAIDMICLGELSRASKH